MRIKYEDRALTQRLVGAAVTVSQVPGTLGKPRDSTHDQDEEADP